MKTADKYGYCERELIEEFMGEHEVVKALYAVAQRSFVNRTNRAQQLLEIFNVAYFVCMRLTDGSGCSLDKALDECPYAWREMDSHAYRNHLLALIYSLLRLHQGLLPVRTVDMDCSKDRVDYYFSWSRYEKVIDKYEGKLTRPLNFSGLTAEVSQAPSATEQVAKPDESDPLQLLVRATNDLVKAHGLMKAQLAAKDKRIEELEHALRLEQAKGRAEMCKKEACIKDLEDALQERIEGMAAREERIKELEAQVRSASFPRNPFCLGKIKDYAKGLDKEEDKVITHMLLNIALDELLPREQRNEVCKAVREVEAAHRKQVSAYVHIERQDNYNYNKDSQVFNGPIDNSKFGE